MPNGVQVGDAIPSGASLGPQVGMQIPTDATVGDATTPKKYAPGRGFGMQVAKGMGLDADAVAKAEDEGGSGAAAMEIGKQVLSGVGGFIKNVAMDPMHIADPIHAMASNLTTAAGLPDKGSITDPNNYHAPNPGQMLGAASSIVGAAEAPGKVAQATQGARESIGTAIHTPEGELTPGAKVAGQVAGGIAGTGAGTLVGHPYVGAAAGYKLGPSLIDKMFPEAESAQQARTQYDQAKSLTEAHESALADNSKVDAATARKQAISSKAAQDAADEAIASREQHAQDLMNRQAQQDKLDAAAAKASNAASRAQRQLETDRQNGLNQRAEDLVNRQKQQDALDKSAQDAKDEAESQRNKTAQDLMNRQKEQDALDKKAVLAARDAWRYRPTANLASDAETTKPINSLSDIPKAATSSPQDLISRMRKIVLPGEIPGVEDLKRAGDFTQVSTPKLQELAKFGDELAKNELRRRQSQSSPINSFSQLPKQ